MKYKIEIEVDLDFEKIFSEAVPGYNIENNNELDDYYKETIYDCLRNSYLYSLQQKTDLIINKENDNTFEESKIHIECEVETSKQLCKKVKIHKL